MTTLDQFVGSQQDERALKPHTALEGQTSAEVTGVGVQSKDNWFAMLRDTQFQRSIKIRLQC
jgi:hypothetical protein